MGQVSYTFRCADHFMIFHEILLEILRYCTVPEAEIQISRSKSQVVNVTHKFCASPASEKMQ